MKDESENELAGAIDMSLKIWEETVKNGGSKKAHKKAGEGYLFSCAICAYVLRKSQSVEHMLCVVYCPSKPLVRYGCEKGLSTHGRTFIWWKKHPNKDTALRMFEYVKMLKCAFGDKELRGKNDGSSLR